MGEKELVMKVIRQKLIQPKYSGCTQSKVAKLQKSYQVANGNFRAASLW